MSRVGKLPVKLPSNIKVSVSGRVINFDNGKVKKSYQVSPSVNISYVGDEVKFSAKEGFEKASTDVGMDRSNVKNIVLGLQTPFKITLEINGVGYKAAVDKGGLFMSLGYSHEIFYLLPKNVAAVFEKPNLIVLTSDDKVLVGQVASEIISFRKPEPYKGKGIKIAGKAIVRKEGKKK
ncbi:MAG: ribosomal protein [Rickettsiaceae bacterium]|jgi:large subunit ribosomal protein L6|nr:ribosomal protein [Rickettsiaceae bacterium]